MHCDIFHDSVEVCFSAVTAALLGLKEWDGWKGKLGGQMWKRLSGRGNKLNTRTEIVTPYLPLFSDFDRELILYIKH